MDNEIAQFSLEDGTKFLVEVKNPEDAAIQRVAIDSGKLVLQAKQTFEEAIDAVKPVASVLVSKLKSGLTTPADEVEVKFGLRLSAEAGAIFTSIGGDVNFEVTLKWTEDKSG
uniref:Trypsin-co-occurring domain-containing protein n=1 Tax=Cyanothece sp. (strain PCC 7425 / ATCC 29141) TaxID=395961 RepID=B8HMX1_CYAP4